MKLFTLEADLMLNAGSFDTGVNNASTKMGSLKTEIEGVAGQAEDTKRRMDIALGTAIGDFIGKMAGALTEAVFEWTGDGIALASSMEETNAKINTIFGDSADNIHRWAETTKDSFGIGELTAKNYAAQVAGILSTDSKNLTSEEITNISTSLVGLAGDLASFHNMNFDEVWGKLLSGLRGETEAIEALGIDLRAANLAEAFGMTTKDWGALDQRTRLLNTYQYIMQETALAQGDFARTSDSYANQMRVLEENINSLKLALGESLLPVMTELVGMFNMLFAGGESTSEAMGNVGSTLGETYASIETTTANALALVDALARMEELDNKTARDQSVWNQLLSDLSATLPGIDKLFNSTTGYIKGGTEALREYVTQWQATQRQIAASAALQEAQQQLTNQQVKVLNLQAEYAAMSMSERDVEGELSRYFGMAREYYGFDQDVDQARVLVELASDKENPYAMYLANTIETLLADEDEEAQRIKEAELLTAQAELAALTEQYAALESQIMQLAKATETPITQDRKQEPKATPQPVTIILQATLDGQEIAATLTPKVTGAVMNELDWKFAQIAR